MNKSTLLFALSALLMTSACDDKKADAKKDEAAAGDKPSLMLSNDTSACRAALKCCEAMVAADKDGKATPEDINLACSGVGMAGDDATCGDFKKGYAAALEAKGGELPADCK